MANRSFNAPSKKLDSNIVLTYIALVIIGLLNIYSATVDVNKLYSPLENAIAIKQLMWIGGAMLIILTITFSNAQIFSYFAYGIYGLTMFLNIAVLFIGREVAGAKSWFGFGSVGIQPSEFAKIGVALALAKFLGSYEVEFKGFKNIAISIGIFMLPIVIILAQNDTGSALVFFSFFLVLYRVGMPGYFLVAALWMGVLAITAIIMQASNVNIVFAIGVLGLIAIAIITYFRKQRIVLFITMGALILSSGLLFGVSFFYNKVLKNYQRNRIEVVLGLKEDKKGSGYNLRQSKIAIGAGEWIGRGYLKGTQTKMSFVPEQETDYIFCTVGEEWGLLGITVLFALFVNLLIRIVVIAEKQQSQFNKLYGYGIACVIFTHFAINIGMTIGFVPTIGIPLPFISFGGSSLWSFTTMVFIFLRIDDRFSK